MGATNMAEPRHRDYRLSEDEEINRNWSRQFAFDSNGRRKYEPPEPPPPRPELCGHCGQRH